MHAYATPHALLHTFVQCCGSRSPTPCYIRASTPDSSYRIPKKVWGKKNEMNKYRQAGRRRTVDQTHDKINVLLTGVRETECLHIRAGDLLGRGGCFSQHSTARIQLGGALLG